MDQFASYVTRDSHRFLVSGDERELQHLGRMRLYGSFLPSIHFIGMSYSRMGLWSDLSISYNEPILNALSQLSIASGAPLIWIGEGGVDWRNGSGKAEVGVIRYAGGQFSCDVRRVDLVSVTNWIRVTFGAGASTVGSAKGYTDSPIDGFQSWFQRNLPRDYAAFDIDLLVVSSTGRVTALVEIKRTGKYAVADWYPFLDDKPNYMLLKSVGRRAGIAPITVNQSKSQPVGDNDEIGFYDLAKGTECTVRRQGTTQLYQDSELSYSRRILRAIDAKQELLSL